MLHLVKYVPHKHEDLSLSPQGASVVTVLRNRQLPGALSLSSLGESMSCGNGQRKTSALQTKLESAHACTLAHVYLLTHR